MPMVELTVEEVSLVEESLGYAKRAVEDGGAPNDVKREKLAKIDEALMKFRQAR